MKKHLMIIVLTFIVVFSGCGKNESLTEAQESTASEIELATELETEIIEIETLLAENSDEEAVEIETDDADHSKEYMNRLMTADLSTAEEPDYGDEWNSIVLLAELPEYDIAMYGYNDDDYQGEGVAIQIGEDVNYFDWYYIAPRRILPELYWDDIKKQLQVALNIYTGTGIGAQQFRVLQQYETGTLSDVSFDNFDYSELLMERLDYSFAEETQILTLIDNKNDNEIAQADLSGLGVVKIEGISAGDIASFQLGEQIWLIFHPGFIVEGSAPPWYDEMPKLKVEVHLQSVEEGIFELGDTIVVETEE